MCDLNETVVLRLVSQQECDAIISWYVLQFLCLHGTEKQKFFLQGEVQAEGGNYIKILCFLFCGLYNLVARARNPLRKNREALGKSIKECMAFAAFYYSRIQYARQACNI